MDILEASPETVIILAFHGTPYGIHDGPDWVDWAPCGQRLNAPSEREFHVMACNSEALRGFMGGRLVTAYRGEVDLEYEAMVAAHRVGVRHLSGAELERFAAYNMVRP